jgi:zona occludens toxin
MLYLSTGTPGSGKTLLTLKYVKENKQFNFLPDGSPRSVYYYNIKILDKSFFPGWIELTDDQATRWYELPSGSVLIFDEAYNIFPAKRGGAEVPKTTKELAVHRHKGFDIFLITQKSTGQVDNFVRGLVNRHFHYNRVFGSSLINRFAWDHCELNTDSQSKRKVSNITTTPLDKRYFGKFHSADQHTHTMDVPWRNIFLLFVALFTVFACFYYAYSILMSDNSDENNKSINATSEQVVVSSPSSFPSPSPSPSHFDDFSSSYIPSVKGIPWSAPIYKEITKPVTWPRPAACVQVVRSGSCSCYSQQGTILHVDKSICIKIVHEGFFDHTLGSDQSIASQSYDNTSRSYSRSNNRSHLINEIPLELPID